MNTKQHTQGQWVMNTTKKFMSPPYLGKGLAITSDKGIVITFVDHTLNDKNVDEYVANAKLIAAAPQLLKALADIVDYYSNHDIDRLNFLLEDNALEAIKKATE